jgi:cell wall-associated NlpC family hydrolase
MGNSLRPIIFFLLVAAVPMGARQIGASSQDESVGEKIKKLFATPTPTPHKKHKASPSPSASPKKKTTPKAPPSAASETPKESESRPPAAKATASPSPRKSPTEAPHHRKSSEAAATNSPTPKHRHAKSVPEDENVTSGEQGESPVGKKKRPASRSPTPTATTTPGEEGSPTPSPSKGIGTHGPVATISSSEIIGYENYPPEVRQLLDRALGLTTQNLDYKYGSADPANGGMDCSGFIYYLLSQGGMKDVPRDAREQYIWVRKAGTFQAVLGHQEDTFELDSLKPGDLLFWSGTYHIDRDPAITHTMIYLGKEKRTNQRIMVGSSDGRTYKGQSRFGVSVFDFKVSPRVTPAKSEEQLRPTFVGYGRIPGLKATEQKEE